MQFWDSKLVRGVTVVFVAALVVVWLAVAYELDRVYHGALREAELKTQVQSRVVAEYATSTFKRVNELILDLRPQWWGDWEAFSRQVRQKQEHIRDITFHISVVDENGYVAFSNLAPSSERVYVGDREHNKIHKESPGVDRLFVSKPVFGKVSRKWSIQFTRPIYRDGVYVGVFLASISPELYSRFAQSMDVGQGGEVTLIRDGGEVMARYPHDDDMLLKMVQRAPFAEAGAPLTGIYRDAASTDGVERIFGYHRVPDYGVTFVVGVSMQEVLRPYFHVRRMVSGAALAVTVFSLLLYLLLVRALIAGERLSRELDTERQRAENASLAKSQFLANMSHEIRSPMNGVLGMTRLLMDTPLDRTQRELAQDIATSGNSLMTIINDILDISKIEAGRFEFEMRPFSLADMLQNVERSLRVKAREKGIELEVRLPDACDSWYTGDSLRIQQVLLNLLGNAIKFTGKGGVQLRVKPGIAGVRFEVVDSGIGIAPEDIGKLFANFMQVDATITRRFGGTGLGLAICKRLVEGMGGAIGVHSVLGEGSCFWFELPLDTALPQSNAGAAVADAAAVPPLLEVVETSGQLPAAAAPQDYRTRILLAEDQKLNQKLAMALLQKLGYSVTLAVDGAQAVALAGEQRYALILMDMQMPELDGLEATRRIRAAEGPNRGTPIVALTANAMVSDREACRDAGMDDFLAKPMDRDVLAACMARWAGRDTQHKAAA